MQPWELRFTAFESMNKLAPSIGAWYRRAGGRLFEVVAVDEDARTIEVQYFDGTVAEFDLESWQELPLQPAVPPEDWAGSLDIEKADYGVDYDDCPHELWMDPLDFLDATR